MKEFWQETVKAAAIGFGVAIGLSLAAYCQLQDSTIVCELDAEPLGILSDDAPVVTGECRLE